MTQFWGQQNLDPYGMNQGGEDASGGMMQSQNSQAMRNNVTGGMGGSGGMGMMGMMSMFARGGAVGDALEVARKHFRNGGPQQVGGYGFKPEFLDEKDALTYGMMAEALKDGDKGMIAVGHNLNNRAWNGYLGDHDVRDVLLHQNARGTAGQYASYLENRPSTNIAGRSVMSMYPRDSEQYQHVHQLAEGIKGGQIADPTNNASHFYNPSTSHPKWGNQLTNTTQIGGHKFGTEHGTNFFNPQSAMRPGDQGMAASHLPLGGPQAQTFAGNPMLPNGMQMPQLQPTPSPSVAPNAPPVASNGFGMPGNGINATPQMQPPAMDNPPVPPMRPQSAPMQSEMSWKPPAEIADKVQPHNFSDGPNLHKSFDGDVQFAPESSPINNAVPSAPNDLFDSPVGSMGDFPSFSGPSDFGGGLGDIFEGLFSRGGRTGFSSGGSEDHNNGAFGDASQFLEEPRRRTLEEHYPKPDNGSDLYAIAHDPREPDYKRYGAMGAGMASDIAHGMWDQVKKPGEALRGEWSPTDAEGRITDEAIGWGANTGLGALGTGTAFHEAPAGSLGMFIGKNAQGIDRQLYDTAQRDLMGYEGGPKPYGDLFSGGAHVQPKTSTQVFDQTGLHPYGKEESGAPRMWGEISDASATTDYGRLRDTHYANKLDEARKHFVDGLGVPEEQFSAKYWPELQKQLRAQETSMQLHSKLSDFYDHPELYEKYPHLRDTPVLIDTTKGSRLLGHETAGSYGTRINGTPGIVLRRSVAKNPESARSTLAHEVQHAIQDYEGIKSLGSKQMADQKHETPAFMRWQDAQSDPRVLEFNELSQHPGKDKAEEAFTSLWNDEYNSRSGDKSKLVEEALNRLHNEHPEFVRATHLARELFRDNIPTVRPDKYVTGHEAYMHQGIEGQSRNTQYRLDWDDTKRRSSNPRNTIPDQGLHSAQGYQGSFIDPIDMIHKAGGGSVDGDVSYDSRLPMMAESPDAVSDALSVARKRSSTPHEFVESQLFNPNDEKQLPQYDPEAGKTTAKQAALTAYGMTDLGGMQQALGYMPKAEGGYEPSVAEDFKGGNYLAAGLGLAGAIVPGAGKLSKAARGTEAVSDALDVARSSAAPAEKAAETFTPATPKIIRPEEIPTKTIRQVLEGNGYFEHPENALYYGALDTPAAKGRTWSDMAKRMNGALGDFYKMSDGDQDRALADASNRLSPYLEKKDGTNADLLSQTGKLVKAQKALKGKYDGLGIETWGVNLTPALQWDILNYCGNSASCVKDCLGKVGGHFAQDGGLHDAYKWNNARGSGLARSIAMMQEPEAFALTLDADVKMRKADARKHGNHLGVRPNVISDLPPVLHDNLRLANPNVDFFDYTKFGAFRPRSPNHHYTFSSTGISSPQLLGPDGKVLRKEVINNNSNWIGNNGMRAALDRGDNVSAVVSQQNHKPKYFLDKETGRRYEAIEGDSHDFRPLDQTPDGQPGKFIVLGRKGNKHKATNAHENSNGFIWHYDPDTMGDTIEIPDQRRFKKHQGGAVKPLDEELFRNQFENYDHYREGKPIDKSARKRG